MNKKHIIFCITVVIILSFSLWHINIRPIVKNNLFHQALYEGNLERKTDLFQKAVDYKIIGNTDNNYILIHLIAMQFLTYENLDTPAKRKFAGLVLDEFENSIKDLPLDARREYDVGVNFMKVEDYKSAIEHLERARQSSPSKQQVLVQLGLCYAYTGEYQKALDIFQEANDLNPSFTVPGILKKKLEDQIKK